MIVQKSFLPPRPTLYLVATPIGHLADMTYRAVETLKNADVIFAEDTRTSATLCNRYGIKTHRESYHKHNEKARTEDIKNRLSNGQSVALISDAGTPLMSDPGATLVFAVIEAGHPVVSIPGANAAMTALPASGIDCTPFLFYGFLPNKDIQRRKTLENLRDIPYTLVFYEAKHRVKTTLKTMFDVFGNRAVTLARELTKQHETYMRTTLSSHADIDALKGEIVLVVEGAKETQPLSKDDVVKHIELLMADGMREMDAIKQAAHVRKMKKNDVYMAFQRHKQTHRVPKE